MRLVSLSIQNYRSIVKSEKLPLDSFTVLLGPNNEGKSNILRALALSLKALTTQVFRFPTWRRTKLRSGDTVEDYWWKSDFPVRIQASNPNGRSRFTIELELTDGEKEEFFQEVRSRWTTTLRLQLGFGVGDITFDVVTPGKAKAVVQKKQEQIAAFVAKHLKYQ